MKKTLRLGTRGSPLALLQAGEVRQKLLDAHPLLHAEGGVEVVSIKTSGDWQPGSREKTLMEAGGDKGLFTKEIEEALVAGYIDMAVHSMKDVPGKLPPGLEIAAVLDRVDPRDAFISNKARTLEELAPGLCVGTASLRRQAQILDRRPDLKVVSLRGNVETRLRKLAEGVADATLLAAAGMIRLGIADRITSIMETSVMLPAVGQGALGLEIRRGDEEARSFAAALNKTPTAVCVAAERAFLKVLDGSCHTPIAALARLEGNARLRLEALAARPDGTFAVRMSKEGAPADAEKIGIALGEEIKSRLPPDFYSAA